MLAKLGVSVEKAAHHYETVWRVIQAAVDQTHMPTLWMGLLALGLFGLRRLARRTT